MKTHEGCSGAGCKKCTHCDDACPVIDTVGREVLFINKTCTGSCPFELSFGSSVVCTCPVHAENYFA